MVLIAMWPLLVLFWLTVEPGGCLGPLPGRLRRALIFATAFTIGAALIAVLVDLLIHA